MAFAYLTCENACAALQADELIVYPTETFYGMGGNALAPDAVAAVFRVKGRSDAQPLPVIIGDVNQLCLVAAAVPPLAQRLMERFWPGPLAILFPAASTVPARLSAGTGKVAVRLSSHPGATALCRAGGFALISSSANVSGGAPVTAADKLDPRLAAGVAGLFDPPPAPGGGAPSSIVDIQKDGSLRMLRVGAVSAHTLRAAGFPLP